MGLWAFTHVSVASYLSVGGPAIIKQLSGLLRNPAIDALYGQPYSVGDPGGFTVWKSGAMMAAIAAIWVVLAVTRLSRGGEDDGTFELLVLGSDNAAAVTRRIALVTYAASLLAGAAVTVGFLWSSLDVASSVLYGYGVALCAMSFAGLALVVSQLVAPRRLASSWAMTIVGVSFVARMVADGTSSFSALRWLSPFGWLEELRAFDHTRMLLVVPWTIVVLALVALASGLSARRDVGSGVVASHDRTHPRVRLLGSSWRFAWRQRLGLTVAWTLSVSVLCAMLGALLHSIVEFERGNASYRALMNRYGFAQLISAKGFVAEIDLLMAVGVGFLALMSLHAEWNDESRGRVEIALSSGPSRVSWLASCLVATVATVIVVTTVASLSLAIAANVSGASLSTLSVLVGGYNAASVALVVLGVATLAHAFAPRAALGVISSTLAASFVVALFGPGLHWPRAVVDLSIFHHLTGAPATPVAWAALGVFALLGVLGVGVGLARYAQRDLVTS